MYPAVALAGGVVIKPVLVVGEKGAAAAGNEPVKPPPPCGGGFAVIVDVSLTVKLAVVDRPTKVLKKLSVPPLAGVVAIAALLP